MSDETKAISLENLTEFKEKCDLAYEPRKNIPTPTSSNNGQVLGVENGNFLFVNQSGGGGGGDYTLPVASPNTLGGVKPVAKTDDMTQSVGVDSNGALWTEPSDGGGEGESNIEIITLPLTAGTLSSEDYAKITSNPTSVVLQYGTNVYSYHQKSADNYIYSCIVVAGSTVLYEYSFTISSGGSYLMHTVTFNNSSGLGTLTWNTATLTASSTGTQINLSGVYICYILASESGSPVFLLNFGVCCFRTGSRYNNTYQCAISITSDSQATPNLSELVSISYQGNTMYLGNASSIGVDTLTLYYAKIADL